MRGYGGKQGVKRDKEGKWRGYGGDIERHRCWLTRGKKVRRGTQNDRGHNGGSQRWITTMGPNDGSPCPIIQEFDYYSG